MYITLTFLMFCNFLATFAPKNKKPAEPQNCESIIKATFKYVLPKDNFLHAFYHLSEDRFSGEKSLPHEAYGYFFDMLNDILISNLYLSKFFQSPLEFCDQNYGITNVIYSFCKDNNTGGQAFVAMYRLLSKDKLKLESVFPNSNSDQTPDCLKVSQKHQILMIDAYIKYLYDAASNNLNFSHLKSPEDYCRKINTD